MIACLIAGVTSAETFMVGGSALFTRNFYVHAVPGRSDTHYLWVGRLASGGLLALGIVLAVRAESVTQLVLGSVKLIGLLGAAFWLGVVWRRASAAAVWASFLGSLLVWGRDERGIAGRPRSRSSIRSCTASLAAAGVAPTARSERARSGHRHAGGGIRPDDPGQPDHPASRPGRAWSVLRPAAHARRQGRRGSLDEPPDDLPESATLGMEGIVLDYRKSSRFAYPRLQRFGLEIPRMTWFDWGGFLAAWVLGRLLL